MKLYRYWASATRVIKDSKGEVLLLKKWGGSNTSSEDAVQNARQEVEQLATKLLSRPDLRRHRIKKSFEEYSYGTRDLPEELLESWGENNGITRNRQGCSILNTNEVFFADIDFAKPTIAQRLGRLFGKKMPDPQYTAITQLRHWISQHPGMGARVYRTAAGLRYLFTDAPRQADQSAILWLSELGSDKLYKQLCQAQQCFRARLSPKPWRVKTRPPASHYPRTPTQDAQFQKWLRDYENKSRAFATCTFIEHLGDTNIHPALADSVSKHDELCRATSGLPLA